MTETNTQNPTAKLLMEVVLALDQTLAKLQDELGSGTHDEIGRAALSSAIVFILDAKKPIQTLAMK